MTTANARRFDPNQPDSLSETGIFHIVEEILERVFRDGIPPRKQPSSAEESAGGISSK